MLAGTLCYPVDYKDGKRIPVVLMVTGSGQQDRNETLFDHQPFAVIADHLARHGIASLRYDDRGVGGSKGEVATATSHNFMLDAEAGIKFLRKLKRFSKVGVLGHSEGGMIAFMMGARKSVDFIVSMAGPAQSGDSISAEQTNIIMRQNGYKVSRAGPQRREGHAGHRRQQPEDHRAAVAQKQKESMQGLPRTEPSVPALSARNRG